MTTFDKREEGFEKKFAHDEELRFKANARRNKLLGHWAAEKLGLTGADADAYAKEVVMADFEEAGDDDVFRKVRTDFEAKGVEQSDHQNPPHHGRADGAGDCPDQGGLDGAARRRPRHRGKAGRTARDALRQDRSELVRWQGIRHRLDDVAFPESGGGCWRRCAAARCASWRSARGKAAPRSSS